tara:strand:- start:1772 stop:1990 length:219 start_codon:yes stop_codon:yes gene_type:complete
MYSSLEWMTISYLNTLNKLKELKMEGNELENYKLRSIVNDAIKEIEKIGGKVRIVENKFNVIEVSEKQISKL